MGIFALLLNNKNLVIAGLMAATVAAGLIYISILKADIATTIAEKNLLVAELEVSQASVKGLQKAITDQNAAIEKLKADADARAASHKADLEKAKISANIYQTQAQYLMNQQAPQNVPKCEAANNLINSEIKNAK